MSCPNANSENSQSKVNCLNRAFSSEHDVILYFHGNNTFIRKVPPISTLVLGNFDLETSIGWLALHRRQGLEVIQVLFKS